MTASCASSIYKGSDAILDYNCTVCEGRRLFIEAISYCKRCGKYFCGQCNTSHKQLHAKHNAIGRDDIDKWPVATAVIESVEQCLEHPQEKIKRFCYNHGQLCCNTCVLMYHKTCTDVKIITGSSNTLQSIDPNAMKANLNKTQTMLKKAKTDQETKLNELEVSYEDILTEIKAFGKQIMGDLKKLEKTTIQELKIARDEFKQSLQNNVTTIVQLNEGSFALGHAIEDIGQKNSRLAFIAGQKRIAEMKRSERLLNDLHYNTKRSISITMNEHIRKSIQGFNKMGQIIINTPNEIMHCGEGATRYNVRMEDDCKEVVVIADICELKSGHYLIGDNKHRKLKLIDNKFRIINSLEFPGFVQGFAHINTTTLAITVSEREKKLHRLYLLNVNNKEMHAVRYKDLPHECYGICRHSDDLYIASNTALHVYTLRGEYVKKIYENKSLNSVYRCAVSFDGQRIYVTACDSSELVTLSNDGSLLSTFKDPEQRNLFHVHVTCLGQVLVCAWTSNTIIQMDYEGRRILAVFATVQDGLNSIRSVYYSEAKKQVVVGQYDDSIVVLNAK